MGTIGLEPQAESHSAPHMMWAQHAGFRNNEDRVIYAILLEVKSFNN